MRRRGRRGVAMLVVLLLISAALAVSYAAMRSQATVVQIQHNAGLAGGARQAAITGLTVALRKMHDADWTGVDSTLTGTLGPGQTFVVTFAAGDPSLSEGDSDYADLPYRVTLTSVGHAAYPAEPSRKATHTARAVVRLVPRNLPDEPSDWARMQDYTVFQTKKDSFEVDIPCQLSGRVRVQGKLKIARHYPDDSDAWLAYLEDLERMRANNWPDYRPFTGPVDLPYDKQDDDDLSVLCSRSDVPTNDVEDEEAADDWSQPSDPCDYQIYEGGPVYAVKTISGTLTGQTLEPDPATNPLGLFCPEGKLEVGDDVTVRGTIFCRDELRITGSNVHIESFDLPNLHGSDGPLRLPAATCRRFSVAPTAGGSLSGLLAVFDDFIVEKGTETTSFVVTGRVITRKFFIKERQPWETADWDHCYDAYCILGRAFGYWYFPVWMTIYGRHLEPRVKVAADATPVSYHWHFDGDCLYIPHPDDASELAPDRPGLRWDLLEWKDGP